MSYRDNVRISTTTVQRIVLHNGGRTTVDVQFLPDRERGKTNGEISINGDYGSFHYCWTATGHRLFSDFLAKIAYDYAMGKLAHDRRRGDQAYMFDWSTVETVYKDEVLRLRKEGSLSRGVARALYDYFDGEYLTESFTPDNENDLLHQLSVEMYPDFCKSERRAYAENVDELGAEPDSFVPLEVMFGGDPYGIPMPKQERAHAYFWDEVWPVILDEVRKVEESSQDQIWGGAENVPGR